MDFKGYTFRLTKFGDAAHVQAQFHKEIPQLEILYGPIDFGRICELSLFSLVAHSPEHELVAFAAFDDQPLLPKGFTNTNATKADSEKRVLAVNWATRQAVGLGARKEVLLWLTVCVSSANATDENEAFVRAMLYTVLSLSHETRVILHTSSLELGAMPSFFKPVARSLEFKFSVCALSRRDILPTITFRRAREEDHDDLCPVIERAQKRGLPLTRVPLSATPSKPYSVARSIRAQTERNNVFLAEVASRIVGVVVLVCDVHVPSLHENYDIDIFEGLAPKRIERKMTVLEMEAAALDPFAMADPFAMDPLATPGGEADVSDDVNSEQSSEESEPTPPTVEVTVEWPDNVFRVAMLCMEVEFESRSIDMIEYAFVKLKKEFCLVTLPYTSPYHPLLTFFQRILDRPNATNNDPELSADKRCLYILHEDALTTNFEIRPATVDDLPALEELLDDFADKDDMLGFITKPVEGRVNIVASLTEHQIVGYAMVATSPPVEAIASHFDLLALLDLQHHPAENHGSLILFSLNPIYRCRTRLFLQEIMRQQGHTVLYCPVFGNQEVPDILGDLILLPGRQHAHMLAPCYWEKSSRENTPATNLNKQISEATLSGQTVSTGSSVKEDENKISMVDDIMMRRQSLENSRPGQSLIISVDPVPDDYAHRGHRKSILIDSGSTEEEKKTTAVYDNWIQSGPLGPQPGMERPSSRADPKRSKGGPKKKVHIEEDNEHSLKEAILEEKAEDGSEQNQVSFTDAAHVDLEVEEDHAEAHLEEKEESLISKRSSSHRRSHKKSQNHGRGRSSSFKTGAKKSSKTSVHISKKSKQARGSYYGFDCALYTMSHSHLYRYRKIVNARIVVVGSSITTAAFFHQLLSSQELQFTNLTMVSSVGFKCLMSTALSSIIVDLGPAYSFPKLGLDCHINVIVATVTGIDRKGHCIALSSGETLTYDWLILSTGLQDQTKKRLGLGSIDPNEYIGIVKTDEIILNAHEISQGMATHAVQGDSIPPVVIYGSTVEAFCAIQKLLQEGLQGPNMLLIHPEPMSLMQAATGHLGDPEIASMLVAILLRQGVSIHSGLELAHVEMTESNQWIRSLKFKDQVREEDLDGMSIAPLTLEQMNVVRAAQTVEAAVQESSEVPLCPIHRSQEIGGQHTRRESKIAYVVEKGKRPKRPLVQPCSLLVTCDKRQVDLHLFRALTQEAIIFDGRVVVDGIFRTNDPSIFAAGSLCKFSRYCGVNLPKLETFCGWELGEAFAAAFALLVTDAMARGDVPADTSNRDSKLHKWPTSVLPWLNKARCLGGFVPGDKWFFAAAAPKFCVTAAGPTSRHLYSRHETAYCRLDVMGNGEIGRIFYMGNRRVPEWKMVRIVGLPVSILNNILDRYDSGEIPDLVDFLSDEWASVLLHDRFLPFLEDTVDIIEKLTQNSIVREKMKKELQEGKGINQEGTLQTETRINITQSLWRFINAHHSVLPHFSLTLLQRK